MALPYAKVSVNVSCGTGGAGSSFCTVDGL
jgi:hypothetical protein